jgi:hypothetical protein
MKENEIILEENKQPLIEIDNEIIEMSKNVKIINSLKEDIDQLISSKNINNNIPTINDKYNKIKTQIQKFMNKKKFIYNFIDNEKLNKKNNNIIIVPNEEEENEKLLEDKNNYQSVKENINKMQNRIITITNNLDKKLSPLNILDKKENFIQEIQKNDIDNKNDNDIFDNKIQIKSSILNLKAEQYNEETKALEETNKLIEEIKRDTNEMKLISNSQGNTINNLRYEHDYIGLNITRGIDQLNERKNSNQSNNTTLKNIVLFLIIIIIISGCILYYKYKYKK